MSIATNDQKKSFERAAAVRRMKTLRANFDENELAQTNFAATLRMRARREMLDDDELVIEREMNTRMRNIQRQKIGQELPNHSSFDEMLIDGHSCGNMKEKCKHCDSLNFADEKTSNGDFTFCCHKGTVLYHDQAESPRQFPDLLRELLCNTSHPFYKNFKANIRSYNSSLSFASMGAQIVGMSARGPYCFKVI